MYPVIGWLMRSLALLTLTACLLFAASAHAGEAAYDFTTYDGTMRKAARLQPEWFACQTTADCALLSIPCMASLAVSAAHKNEAQAAIDKKFNPSFGCDATMIDNSFAICEKGQCLTRRDRTKYPAR